ncbi:MAG: VWA domain-containing protein, partial [Myxococcales bacterium]|nr:VWA domain-containing protein [Myxococcales bacterium]
RVGYKPLTPRFFELLRWKQTQATDGRRAIAIGAEVTAVETLAGLGEASICAWIVAERPSFKRLVGMLPAEVGLTRAIVAASVEAGVISDTELVILTPTLEDLGLLGPGPIAERWRAATDRVENQRAAHIATRVRSKETAERLEAAADAALAKAVATESRDLRVYVAVDISGSMSGAIEKAKGYLAQFLQGFALPRLHVCVFDTKARPVTIRHASARGVEHAFAGFIAGGGTNHAAAFTDVFRHHPPAAGEDALVLFVGDQQESGSFEKAVADAGIHPVAFGFLNVPGVCGVGYQAVERTAAALDVPCFPIDEGMFGDAYAVTRTLRHLIASTPVRAGVKRETLFDAIAKTPLLEKPVWA